MNSTPFFAGPKSPVWLFLAGVLLSPAAKTSAQLFSDNFDGVGPTTVMASGTSSGYVIKFSSGNPTTENFTAIFGFDYSTWNYPLPIPSAPNSTGGTTKGLYLTVNKSPAFPNGLASGTAPGTNAAVNLYPVGQSFSGNYKVKYDVWMNWTNLTYSTEHALVGINHSGNLTNRMTAVGSDGIFTAMTGDGGSSSTSTTARDYSLFQGKGPATAPLLYRTNNQAFTTILGTQFEHANPGFQTLFPDKVIPGYASTAGMPGMGWVTGEIWQTNNVITWILNGTVVAEFANTNAYASGNILLGYNDVFNSMGDTNDFAIFDNIRVEALGGPPSVYVTNSIPTASEGGTAGQFTLVRVIWTDERLLLKPSSRTGCVLPMDTVAGSLSMITTVAAAGRPTV
jgi:hypothetical protein